MARGIALVLVDFDDTLVETAPRFLGARRALFARLAELGFSEEGASEVHHERVERDMMRRYGLGPARLEHSFRETYMVLCEEAGSRPDGDVAAALAGLGRTVAGTPPAIDGAIDALRALAAEVPTVLYTQAGDADYQLGCVRETGVLEVLPAEHVRICPRKTAEAFREAVGHYGVPAEEAWMVGNSIRSDVNPALAAGANAILIELDDPWEFDLVEPLSDGFVRVRSFPEAVRFLLER